MTKILVTAKVNPDLDGVACTLAYADYFNQLKNDAEGVIFDSPQSEVGYFIHQHGIKIPTREDDGKGEWKRIVLVDASSMKGMPKVVTPEKVVEIIDHRKGEPEKEFLQAKIQNDLIGAAATIVTERFMQMGILPKPDHAKLLYGAIYHNTLNFIATNATDRDRGAAKFLELKFGLSEQMVREMFNYATREVVANPKMALENDAKEFGDGYTIRAYQLIVWGAEIFNKREKIEKIVASLNKKFNVEWAFLNIIDLENKKSHLYTPDKVGQEIILKAIGINFENGWGILDHPLLRKQIMPKVQEVISHAS